MLGELTAWRVFLARVSFSSQSTAAFWIRLARRSSSSTLETQTHRHEVSRKPSDIEPRGQRFVCVSSPLHGRPEGLFPLQHLQDELPPFLLQLVRVEALREVNAAELDPNLETGKKHHKPPSALRSAEREHRRSFLIGRHEGAEPDPLRAGPRDAAHLQQPVEALDLSLLRLLGGDLRLFEMDVFVIKCLQEESETGTF